MNSSQLRLSFSVCAFILQCFTNNVSFAKGGASMDGGGGKGTEINRAEPELAQIIYNKEKPLLFVFLNTEVNKLYNNEANQSNAIRPMADKLFSRDLQSSKIHEKLSSLKIDFLTDRTCHDKFLNSKHGSIYPINSEFDICISAFELSREYSARDFNEQLLGLVIHEVAHLLSATEEESQLLQKLFISQYDELKKKLTSMHYVYDRTIGALATTKFHDFDSSSVGKNYRSKMANGIWLADFLKKSPFKIFKEERSLI